MGEEMLQDAVAALTSESLCNIRGCRSRGGMCSRSSTPDDELWAGTEGRAARPRKAPGPTASCSNDGDAVARLLAAGFAETYRRRLPACSPPVHPPRSAPNILPPIAQPCKVSAVRFQRAWRILDDEPFFVVSDRTGDDCAPPVATGAPRLAEGWPSGRRRTAPTRSTSRRA